MSQGEAAEWASYGVNEKPFSTSLPPRDDAFSAVVYDYLRARRLDPRLAVFNGWYASRSAGDTYVRCVIPCVSKHSDNRYWQARCVEDVAEAIRYQSPSHVRRGDAVVYVVPFTFPGVKGTCFVEGPMDALAAAGLGYIGVAWMGMRPNDEVFAAAKLYAVPPFYVIADEGDEAQKAALDIWRRLPGAQIIKTYPFKDLADATPEAREELIDG